MTQQQSVRCGRAFEESIPAEFMFSRRMQSSRESKRNNFRTSCGAQFSVLLTWCAGSAAAPPRLSIECYYLCNMQKWNASNAKMVRRVMTQLSAAWYLKSIHNLIYRSEFFGDAAWSALRKWHRRHAYVVLSVQIENSIACWFAFSSSGLALLWSLFDAHTRFPIRRNSLSFFFIREQLVVEPR